VSFEFAAFLILSALTLIVGAVLGQRLGTWFPPRLLLIALGFRIVGSTVRYEVLRRFYGGLGDAVVYYYDGLEKAGLLTAPGQSFLTLDFWQYQGGSWWGTPFLTNISSIVLSVIGPSMRAEFLVFSLFAFFGLYLIARAFWRVQPGDQARSFTLWIWCWPSLWFWPASVGKEAVILLAFGLVVSGYAGDGKRMNWILAVAGLGLAFAIRPHVAAVLAMAAVSAHWLGTWTRFSLRRVAESIVALVVAVIALQGMAAQFGLDLTDAEGVQEFVSFRATRTQTGGSEIAPISGGPTGIPMAFVNIWMRPFPWDVHNATALVAALEILVFWYLVWKRREGVILALRNWRRHRLLRFAVPLLIAYTLMIGFTFSNLGIIARQRSPVFPFMLMLALAAPEAATAASRRSARGSPARQRVPATAR
jgi:hypothetical protein